MYIHTVPTKIKFRVPGVRNKNEGGSRIDVRFVSNSHHVTLSPPGQDWALPVHKDQIDDLRQALKDCQEIIEERDRVEADGDKE